jgi:uncharacterized membrane protein YesL
MRLAFRVVKYAVLDFFEEFFLLILFNVLWCVSALLLALPLPFATAGLVWVAVEIGEGKAISWRTFFEGGRRHWKPAYLWGLANLIVWVLIFVNIRFYGNLDAAWALIFRSLIISAAIIWGGMQLYVFPLLIRQEDPSLRLAYRNGLVLMGAQPILTILLFLVVIVLLLISVRLTIPLLVLTFALIALLANRAVAEALKEETDQKAL